ncbi:uncharacterized protein BP5553_00793 [Venustampulla echinocandica]|uniref:Centrosomin N-terminal motif 1 domain-containing protein n=1 Tax=Venustampulla echinocandica TaxID=2656787 RepID=A0A370TZ77_9HELO|nr:uncharacterized protein BP5553_00793 [Venustampulla echinocandica]RDL40814.1 hypothetical protein BP5553_00793 [Venustampulla echinocandica]
MEDSSQDSRRSRSTRPGSSSSSNTRMTPASSSNGSVAHLPLRSTTSTGSRVPSSAGSSLLQDRLRERKVESARLMRRGSIDTSVLGERGGQSSPITATMARDERRPISGNVATGKGMGVKQIEEQVSTLHKQNFDLKLELFHRRQRQETLEAQLDAAEKKIEEQVELQEVNEQLLAELEKRDHAVEEAVGIIVTLEDKVDRLMKEREGVKAIEADFESTYFRPGQDDDIPSSPPQLDDLKPTRSSNSVVRMPSFLSEQSEGAEALRSLYLPANHGHSDVTLPTLVGDGMDSPRLSTLSESSFVSIYGEKPLLLEVSDQEEESESPPPERKHRASVAVEKWIDERPVPAVTPARPSARSMGMKSQYRSINDVLQSPLQKLERLKHTLATQNHSLISAGSQLPGPTQTAKVQRKSKETLRRAVRDQTSFERHQTLPPTPDTFSSDTLKHLENSRDEVPRGQRGSENQTFLNNTAVFQSFHPSRSDVSVRPRSAGETVTSRRDGHGWDTETQDDFSDIASIASSASKYNPPSYRHPQRVMTPDLFTFGGTEEWGRDVMLSGPSYFPSLPSDRHRSVQRSIRTEYPRSDDTITPRRSRMKNEQNNSSQHGTPVEMSKPYPPDRRSSLTATTKLKGQPNPPSQSPTTNSPLKDKDSRISRLSGRIFGRSESSPSSPATKTDTTKAPSYVDDGMDVGASATPPPIKRTRPSHRPVSAGVGSGNRSQSFRYDVPADEDPTRNNASTAEVDGGDAKAAPVGGKKWFGIGRAGSIRRN